MALFKLTKSKPIIIYRYVAGDYVDGNYIEGTSTEITIQANLQPAKYWDIQSFPEHDRTKKWCKFWTESLVRTMKEGTGGYGADRFYWQGDLYEVRKVQEWDMGHQTDHFHGLAVRVEQTPDEVEL